MRIKEFIWDWKWNSNRDWKSDSNQKSKKEKNMNKEIPMGLGVEF